MRFFKYLFFFLLLLISFHSLAAWKTVSHAEPNKEPWKKDVIYSSVSEVCSAFQAQFGYFSKCEVSANGTRVNYTSTRWGLIHIADYIQHSCPTSGTTDVKTVPFRLRNSQVCINSCLWNPVATAGMVCGDNSGMCATDFTSAGTICSQNSDLTPTQEDKDNTAPPDPEPPQEPECKNETGSDSYCPKPPQGCPSGYSEQTFNDEAICVKDSPHNPNPNDPNNNDNQPPASEPNGGNDNNQGGGDVDLTPVINAINSLKNALVSAINSVSSKIDSLITGQNKTNEHLDKIEKESVKTNQKLDTSNNYLDQIEKESVKTNENLTKTNEKLDKSNEHLKKIEESGRAASEVLGDIKDFLTEEYEPDDKDSDTKLDVGSISVGEYESNYVTWSVHCPPDQHVQINLMGQNSTLVLSWSPWCELLSKLKWAIIACAYFAAAYIILGMR